MKSKDKQIRELKESKSDWKSFAIMFLVFFIILAVAIIFSPKINYLEQELQSCQEKVPVWTLKVECDGFYNRVYGNINSTIIIQGKSYEDYRRVLEEFQEAENCEVLE